jgi:hypothetical protein
MDQTNPFFKLISTLKYKKKKKKKSPSKLSKPFLILKHHSLIKKPKIKQIQKHSSSPIYLFWQESFKSLHEILPCNMNLLTSKSIFFMIKMC